MRSPPLAEAIQVGTRITPEQRDWLLEKLRFPVVATIRSDGMPSQSVMWFDLDPEHYDLILLNTRADRFKGQHLSRDARISLCFEDGLDYLTVEGSVELDHDPERGLARIQALARRYGDDPEVFAGQQRVNIAVHVERVIHHH
jgi:PPOX class probable F420-dependent enzyme